jgi:hypothetical protein
VSEQYIIIIISIIVRETCLVVYSDSHLVSSHSTLLRVTPHRYKVSLLDDVVR